MGELEARKLKYPNTGTEALLMGILIEGTSFCLLLIKLNVVRVFRYKDPLVSWYWYWLIANNTKSSVS